MIKLLGSVPKTICVAVSGGLDSMAALDFLTNNTARRVVALYFNHGTDHGHDAEGFVRSYCRGVGVPCVTGSVTREIKKGESKEAYWRSERYGFFNNWTLDYKYFSSMPDTPTLNLFSKAPIITCHHLDDAVETWIFTSLHGNSKLIPYKRDQFLRPFLLSRKSDLRDWCEKRSVPYITDPSNTDTSYMRNFIRHDLLPSALRVNPGLHKVVKKKIQLSYKNTVDIN